MKIKSSLILSTNTHLTKYLLDFLPTLCYTILVGEGSSLKVKLLAMKGVNASEPPLMLVQIQPSLINKLFT